MGYSEIQLGKSLIDSFISTIKQNPLQEGEVRQIEDAGDTYIALTSSTVDVGLYAKQYDFTIDDVEYSIYARL